MLLDDTEAASGLRVGDYDEDVVDVDIFIEHIQMLPDTVVDETFVI